MNDLKRAAIVLLSLDKPKAARVMNHLPKDLMELVSLEIARTDDVTRMEQEEAINTFREAVDSRTVIERGSLDLAGELLSQSIGEEEANEIIKNIRDSLKSVPFGFLHKFKAEDVLNFISEEQPQTIALIMSNLPTGLAADILKDLPPDKQLDVIRRVASMEQTSPEFVEMVEASLKNRMVSVRAAVRSGRRSAAGCTDSERCRSSNHQKHSRHDGTGIGRSCRRNSATDVCL